MNYFALFMILVILTNMITNVIKGWGWIFAERPKVVVVVVAELLAMLATVAVIQTGDIVATWYHYAAGAIAGAVVSYVAMYGYDSLYEDLVANLKGLKNLNTKDDAE